MQRMTIDSELRQRLGGLQRPVELCDESGRLVARFYPVLDPNEYDLTPPEIDKEGGEPRSPILDHLEDS